MADKYQILIAVEGSNASADKALKDTGNLIDSTERKATKLSNSMKLAGEGFTKTGKSLTIGLTVPLTAAAVAVTKFSLDLNSGLANVSTLIPQSGERILELKENVKDLSIETGKSFEDLTGGLYQVISAFGDSDETFARLTITSKAAKAGLSSTTEALKLISAVTKAYGDTSAKAQRKVSDLGFTAVRLGETSFPELASAITQATDTANRLGVSQEELFNTYATLTGVTGNAAIVTTQFRSAMVSLENPSEELSKMYIKLGVDSGKAFIAQYGLAGAMEQVKNYAEENDLSLKDLIRRVEGMTFASSIGGSMAETYATKMIGMKDAVGATNEAFLKQTQGINKSGFSMEQTKQRIAVLGSEFGDTLVPILDDATKKAFGLVESFGEMSTESRQTAIEVGIFAASIGPALLMIGKLTKALGVLVANPIALAITGVALLTAGLVLLVRDTRRKQLAEITEEFKNLTDAVEGGAESVEGLVMALHAGSIGNFTDVADQVYDLSKSFKTTEDTVLRIGLASKDLSTEYKNQLQKIKDQRDEQFEQLHQSYKYSGSHADILLSMIMQEASLTNQINLNNKLNESTDESKSKYELLTETMKTELKALDSIYVSIGLTEREHVEMKLALREAAVKAAQDEAQIDKQANEERSKFIADQQTQIEGYHRNLANLQKTEEERLQTSKDSVDQEKKNAETRERLSDELLGYYEKEIKRIEKERQVYIDAKADQAQIDAWYAQEITALNNEIAENSKRTNEKITSDHKTKKEERQRASEELANVEHAIFEAKLSDSELYMHRLEEERDHNIQIGMDVEKAEAWLQFQLNAYRDESAKKEKERQKDLAQTKKENRQKELENEKKAMEIDKKEQDDFYQWLSKVQVESLNNSIDLLETYLSKSESIIQNLTDEYKKAEQERLSVIEEAKAEAYDLVKKDYENQLELMEELDEANKDMFESMVDSALDSISRISETMSNYYQEQIDSIDTVISAQESLLDRVNEEFDDIIDSYQETSDAAEDLYNDLVNEAFQATESLIEDAVDLRDTRIALAEDTRDELIDASESTKDSLIEDAEDVRDASIQASKDTLKQQLSDLNSEADARSQTLLAQLGFVDSGVNPDKAAYEERLRAAGIEAKTREEITAEIISYLEEQGATEEQIQETRLKLLQKNSLTEEDILNTKLSHIEDLYDQEVISESSMLEQKIALVELYNADEVTKADELASAKIQIRQDLETELAVIEEERATKEQEYRDAQLIAEGIFNDTFLSEKETFIQNQLTQQENFINDYVTAEATAQQNLLDDLTTYQNNYSTTVNTWHDQLMADNQAFLDMNTQALTDHQRYTLEIIAGLNNQRANFMIGGLEHLDTLKNQKAKPEERAEAWNWLSGFFGSLGNIGDAIIEGGENINAATERASGNDASTSESTKLWADYSYAERLTWNKNNPGQPHPAATGMNNFMVPPGYDDDNYKIGVRSGERVTVKTPMQAEGGGSNTFNLMIDSDVLGRIITKMSNNGDFQINPKVVVEM